MKFNIIINKGIGWLFLSQDIFRPNIKTSQQIVKLVGNSIVGLYYSNNKDEHHFTKDSIYIGIESNKEMNISIQFVFGKGNII